MCEQARERERECVCVCTREKVGRTKLSLCCVRSARTWYSTLPTHDRTYRGQTQVWVESHMLKRADKITDVAFSSFFLFVLLQNDMMCGDLNEQNSHMSRF